MTLVVLAAIGLVTAITAASVYSEVKKLRAQITLLTWIVEQQTTLLREKRDEADEADVSDR